jgi:DNA-binding transcriptional regulator YdaS (Cro superfamily)
MSYFSEERGNAARLARGIGVSAGFLTQVADGSRPCPPRVAVKIERFLVGRVKRQDLVEDWGEIWPELDTPTTPPPHTAQGAEQGVANA